VCNPANAALLKYILEAASEFRSVETQYFIFPTTSHLPLPPALMASQASSSGQTQRAATQSAATPSQSTAATTPLTRQEQELATENRTLAEFLLMLDDYEPLVSVQKLLSSYTNGSVDSQRGHRLLPPTGWCRVP
jgi:hypothetical protein